MLLVLKIPKAKKMAMVILGREKKHPKKKGRVLREVLLI